MNKIDLIINALEFSLSYTPHYARHEAALAAARELRNMKPVAWEYKGDLYGIYPCDWVSPDDSVTPLYALGDDK